MNSGRISLTSQVLGCNDVLTWWNVHGFHHSRSSEQGIGSARNHGSGPDIRVTAEAHQEIQFSIRSCSRGILITAENISHRIIHLIKKLLQACTQETKTSWINVFEGE